MKQICFLYVFDEREFKWRRRVPEAERYGGISMEGEGLGADGKGQPGSNADPPAPVFCCQPATLGADPRSPPETLPPRRV